MQADIYGINKVDVSQSRKCYLALHMSKHMIQTSHKQILLKNGKMYCVSIELEEV